MDYSNIRELDYGNIRELDYGTLGAIGVQRTKVTPSTVEKKRLNACLQLLSGPQTVCRHFDNMTLTKDFSFEVTSVTWLTNHS